jgi:hypothetical protein
VPTLPPDIAAAIDAVDWRRHRKVHRDAPLVRLLIEKLVGDDVAHRESARIRLGDVASGEAPEQLACAADVARALLAVALHASAPAGVRRAAITSIGQAAARADEREEARLLNLWVGDRVDALLRHASPGMPLAVDVLALLCRARPADERVRGAVWRLLESDDPRAVEMRWTLPRLGDPRAIWTRLLATGGTAAARGAAAVELTRFVADDGITHALLEAAVTPPAREAREAWRLVAKQALSFLACVRARADEAWLKRLTSLPIEPDDDDPLILFAGPMMFRDGVVAPTDANELRPWQRAYVLALGAALEGGSRFARSRLEAIGLPPDAEALVAYLGERWPRPIPRPPFDRDADDESCEPRGRNARRQPLLPVTRWERFWWRLGLWPMVWVVAEATIIDDDPAPANGPDLAERPA